MGKTDTREAPAAALPPDVDGKLKAFTACVHAVGELSKSDQLNVLSAAAKYFGLTIKLDV